VPETTPGRFPGVAPIDAYGNGGFRFAGMSHRGSILCLPDGIEAWQPTRVDQVTEASLARVLELRSALDFVLLGTGEEHKLPPAAVRAAFAAVGLALDIMSTGAAARTYNVMLGDGRRVAAALIVTGLVRGA
jgi:uncharacterized protein